jgi:diguanylate cyclase (GGDEF)-like protein
MNATIARRPVLLAVHLAILALIALTNAAVDARLQFSVFYLIPILTGAYWGGRGVGLLTALAASIAWSLNAEYRPGDADTRFAALWNSVSALAVYVTLAIVVSGFARERRRALALARTDELTGLANARAVSTRIVEEVARARRTGRSFAVLCIDCDNLKSINDRYGHAVGDQLLIIIAKALASHRRRTDLVARLGGDEFIALLTETDAVHALAVAERMRRLVQAAAFRPAGAAVVGPSVSIGVATSGANPDHPTVLLHRADVALYEAKRGGRNRVVLWRGDPLNALAGTAAD